MLRIYVPAREYYNERTEMFIDVPATTLELEHSLVSISKWEAKWGKAFLGEQEKTTEETFDYIKCMTMNDVNPMVYDGLSHSQIQQITEYINSKQCASYLPEVVRNKEVGGDVVTAELIYYWLVALQIPFECQHWHLNRLLTLVQICNMKNNPDKNKMSRGDLLRRNAALNAQRRAQRKARRK